MSQRLSVEVPAQFHRVVIGNKGATIQSIQQQCKTKFSNVNVRVDCDAANNLILISSNSEQANLFVKDQIHSLLPNLTSFTTESFTVPKNKHSLIIGRNGENIQEIRRTCGDGFDLQMPDRNSASDQVQLSGSPQQIQQAKTIIQQIISGGSPSVNPAQNSERIQIPKQYHSGIIGAGGSSLQTIIQQSRVQAIKFPPANEPTDEIIIIGSSSEIRAAKNLIHAKIAALEQQQAESDRLYNKQREQSNIHAQNRNRFYEAASRAYQSGDRAEAFSLSQQGKKEHHRMLKAQHQAALNIFKAKNKHLIAENTIDLHGLHMVEACVMVEIYLTKFAKAKKPFMKIVCGKGIHSQADPRIKPAILELLQNKSMSFVEDEQHGCIIATL